MKKTLSILFLLVFLGCSSSDSNKIIYYYGETCGHCKVVEDFIQGNDIKTKITFEQKEVFDNSINAKDYLEKAKKCGLETKYIETPMLWDGKTCLKGSEDIIKFFKEKAGI